MMKTKRSLLTLVAVAIIALASATEIPKVSLQPINADQVIVSVLNNSVSNLELSIYADNGDIVYFKQTEKPVSSYQKLFDMENLENGEYKLSLKVNGTNQVRNFKVTSKKIYFGESEIDFDPYFTFDGKDLKFSFLNFKKEMFKMEIFENDELVYKTKIGKKFPINSGYDLSKLEAGNYKVVLSSFDKKYIYHFQK